MRRDTPSAAGLFSPPNSDLHFDGGVSSKVETPDRHKDSDLMSYSVTISSGSHNDVPHLVMPLTSLS
jgi:hypothetical protein